MKYLLVLASLTLTYVAQAQLYVQPSTAEATYIYVDDTFIFVEEDIELSTNRALTTADRDFPNILLRNEAQLLQGNDTALNAGNGLVSVYQEGTVNNFDYNIWASPVGLTEADAAMTATSPGNRDFAFRPQTAGYIDNILWTPTTVTLSNEAVAVTGFDGNSSLNNLNIASYWLWTFKSGTNYAEFIHLSNINSLEAGYGFTMKGVSGTDTNSGGETTPNNNGNFTDGEGQRYDFRGRPNNGTITGVTVGPTTNTATPTQTMVGNPYPSALDLSRFLIENSGSGVYSYTFTNFDGTMETVNINRKSVTNGIAYFWDSDPTVNSHYLVDYQGGYGTFSPIGVMGGTGVYVNASYLTYTNDGDVATDTTNDGAFYERRFSPVGQGFFITGAEVQNAPTNPTELIFTNDQRIYIPEGVANHSEFRSNEENTNDEVVPGIGVAVYYPDVTALEKPRHIKILAGINDTYSRQLAIAFSDEATEGVDIAMDAQTVDQLGTDVGFIIGENSNYVINAVPRDEYQWIPLSLKLSETTELKFTVEFAEQFEYNDVFLVDNLTGDYHQIYEDEAIMQLDAGVYDDRFFIRFTDQAAEEEEEEEEDNDTEEEEDTEEEVVLVNVEEQDPFVEESTLESFTILQNNTNNQLEIYNPEIIDINNVSLFDMLGKQIFKEIDMGAREQYIFPTNTIATGIYIVKFTTASGLTKGRKISVVN